MRLVASPYLSPEDAEAIATGLKQREEVITGVILEELDRFACLAWLLSQGVLEIKLAVAQAQELFGFVLVTSIRGWL